MSAEATLPLAAGGSEGIALNDPSQPVGQRMRHLDDEIYRPLETFPTKRWSASITVTSLLAGLFFYCFSITVVEGIGLWGNNNPVGWGWAITNFVFWIGIGHAGTLISAILFLLRQRWRTGIARFAEAMTIFAVICALQFPLIHTGRPWLAGYWLLPLPNANNIWVNFRSPLMWDVFAVSTYGLVSLMFWYTGLIPDLAIARDRAKNKVRKFVYGLMTLGLDRQQPLLEPLREGLPALRRALDAAGAQRAQRGLLRLRRLGHSRLAHHDLPALLRGRRDLQRLRHGGT